MAMVKNLLKLAISLCREFITLGDINSKERYQLHKDVLMDNSDFPLTIVFDIDGILVDNIEFEDAVTEYIIRTLANTRNISLEDASCCWFETLEKHRDHREWHDYGLHCRSLGINTAWKQAHESSQSLLKKFAGIEDALQAARVAEHRWVATDASEWVANFKLSATGLTENFDEVISSTRWALNKGQKDYWHHVAELLPNPSTFVVFVENRYDRIESALSVLERCICIWVQTPDHAKELGFCPLNVERCYRNSVIIATHESLGSILSKLLSDKMQYQTKLEQAKRGRDYVSFWEARYDFCP